MNVELFWRVIAEGPADKKEIKVEMKAGRSRKTRKSGIQVGHKAGQNLGLALAGGR